MHFHTSRIVTLASVMIMTMLVAPFAASAEDLFPPHYTLKPLLTAYQNLHDAKFSWIAGKKADRQSLIKSYVDALHDTEIPEQRAQYKTRIAQLKKAVKALDDELALLNKKRDKAQEDLIKKNVVAWMAALEKDAREHLATAKQKTRRQRRQKPTAHTMRGDIATPRIELGRKLPPTPRRNAALRAALTAAGL